MSSNVSLEYLQSRFGPNTSGITSEGGFFQTFTNATGAPSVKGTIVVAGSTANSVSIAPASSVLPIGVIYESGIPNGSPVKVITYGRGQVLLQNGEAGTAGYWCAVSALVPGRMIQAIAPLADLGHSREIGHSLQSVSQGTDVLCYIQIHFN